RNLARRTVSFRGVLFRQFVDDDLGCASYLIGDPSEGQAFLVDPAYAIEQYLERASADGVRIVRVLETHTHADHVSGHGRFALEHGVPVSVHPLAEPEYAYEPLDDGQALHAGAGAEGLFHSLRRLTELPDGHDVYPGHVAGSLCGAAMSPAHSSTIGAEKRANTALAFGDMQEFIASSAAV